MSNGEGIGELIDLKGSAFHKLVALLTECRDNRFINDDQLNQVKAILEIPVTQGVYEGVPLDYIDEI